MFDIDNLDNVHIDRAAREKSAEVAPSIAPKSREDRLRDFYESRKKEQQSRELQQVHELPSQDSKDEALALRKRGNDQHQAGDYEAAVEFYSTAIKMSPSAVLHSNRAASYIMLGWWDQALRDTKAALRKDPSNEKALERQGKCFIMLDDLPEALRVAQEIEARVPAEDRGNPKKLPPHLKRLRWLAANALDPVKLDEVQTVVNELKTKVELTSPLGIRIRRVLVRCLVDRSDAIENRRRIRPALPINRRTEEDGEEVEEITPFAEEALRITGELMEDSPDDADLRYWRSRALVRLGRHEDAAVQLQHGLKEKPEHQQLRELAQKLETIDELKLAGNAYYRDGRLREAIRAYTDAIDRDPECEDVRAISTLYYNRSAAYRRCGEFQQALEDVNLCLALHPKWAKGLYRRGILLLECGRAAEALTELKVVQRADPTFDEELDNWIRRAHNWLAKPKGEENYYLFMRLPLDATKDDLKKQYKKLCLMWHPDKNPTQDGQKRFEELRLAYNFLMDDEQREQYDFGAWKDKAVRHHMKKRVKVKDIFDDCTLCEDTRPPDPRTFHQPAGFNDRHLIEDDKVEHSLWAGRDVPDWLQEKRNKYNVTKFGDDYEM